MQTKAELTQKLEYMMKDYRILVTSNQEKARALAMEMDKVRALMRKAK